MSKQTERITKMEDHLNESRAALDALEKALEAYASSRKNIRELERYYSGRQWMKDYESWEKGELPEDLRCGVLSEDAVYDLLTDERDLVIRMSDVVGRYLKENR